MKFKLKKSMIKAAALTMIFSLNASSVVFAGDCDISYHMGENAVINKISENGTIYIVGDSTACEYGYDENYAVFRAGWGMYLPKYISGNRKVVNLALSGRSSKSFTVEENYKKLKESLRAGDCLLIQFGHNDAKKSTEEDLKNRYTDPEGDINIDGSFKNSLYKNYIKLAEEKGAVPVLISPVARRKFDENGRIIDSHGSYDDAVEELAKETGVNFIDMTAKTERLYNIYGTEFTKAFHAAYKDKTKGIDNTHYNAYGANMAAYQIAMELGMKYDFYQETLVTRGEFIEGLMRVIGETEKTEEDVFTDIPASHKYAASIATAKKAGITNGDVDGKFNPDKVLKSYDAVVFIMRALRHVGIECPKADITAVKKTFYDTFDVKREVESLFPGYAFDDCMNFLELIKQNSEYILNSSETDENFDVIKNISKDNIYYIGALIMEEHSKGVPIELKDGLFIALYELISNKEKTEVVEMDLNEIEKVE